LDYKLYRSDGAIAIIPNLCIHLSDQSGNEIKLNEEQQLRPIFASETFEKMNENDDSTSCDDHYKGLFNDIASKLDCSMNDIVDFDLCFADANPGAIFGLNKEFIAASRLDNLFTSWAITVALENDQNVDNTADINIGAMFDHEEIGSNTIAGANSRIFYQKISLKII
jgi:aspartyl aminopeptidase